MRNLFEFIWRNRYYLLFVILETIAFSIIINSSIYQQWAVQDITGSVVGSINKTTANIGEFFTLKKDNVSLALENAKLRQQLDAYSALADTLGVKPRISNKDPQYQYTYAKVIKNSVTLRNNYLMLDRGRLSGIEKDMAVIAPNGVVGIVLNVSNNYSWVMSVLNQNTKINGKLLKNNFQGSLTWDGITYHTGTLRDIPAHIELLPGDTIVTSGFSLMFPEGIMIGTVKDSYIDKGDHFHTVKVDFSVDYNNLRHVYVVKNLRRKEQLSTQQYL